MKLIQFPLLSPHVYGEESSTFTNALGESVSVKVCQTQALTEELLAKVCAAWLPLEGCMELNCAMFPQVLDGDRKAAHILARAVHEELPLPSLSPEQCLEMEGVWLDASQLGVWIDPIGRLVDVVALVAELMSSQMAQGSM